MNMNMQIIEARSENDAYISIATVSEGMLHLFLAEKMIIRIDQRISVGALACILAAANDAGLQRVVNGYLASLDRELTISVTTPKPLTPTDLEMVR